MVVVIAAAGTLLTKGIFSIIRVRGNAGDIPILYADIHGAINYLSISNLTRLHRSRWINYLVFRFAPIVFTSFTLLATLQRLDIDSLVNLWRTALFFLAFYLAPVVYMLYTKRPYTSVFLLHVLTILITVGIVLVILIFLRNLSVVSILPSATGLRDNLWGILIAAVGLSVYWNATNMGKSSEALEHHQTRELLIHGQKAIIQEKFGYLLHQLAHETGVDENLMLSILTYESLNRPKPVRLLENVLVLIPGLKLTVGVAQVRHHAPLSDAASIEIMADKLSEAKQRLCDEETDESVFTEMLIRHHNSSDNYYHNILFIMEINTLD